MITDEDLNMVPTGLLNQALVPYPAFKNQLPKDWPDNKKYRITHRNLLEYSKEKSTFLWDHINLPILLGNVMLPPDKKTYLVLSSILNKLEWFSLNMSNKEGFKSILRPLWEQAWDLQDASFWSVISTVFMVDLLQFHGHDILRFEGLIGAGPKKADIVFSFKDKAAFVDIESRSLTKDIVGDQDAFRKLIESRAKQKIVGKFAQLPDDQLGVAALVYRVNDKQLERFTEQLEQTDIVSGDAPNKLGKTYWLVTGGYNESTWALRMVDASTRYEVMEAPKP